MARARARHILVPTADQAQDLMLKITQGADFGDIARVHSQCPSGSRGGDLGEFAPGQMVQEFNDVCFKEQVGVVHGPVRTQFGYHLIEITARTD